MAVHALNVRRLRAAEPPQRRHRGLSRLPLASARCLRSRQSRSQESRCAVREGCELVEGGRVKHPVGRRLPHTRVLVADGIKHRLCKNRPGTGSLPPQLLQDVARQVKGQATVGSSLAGLQALPHHRDELLKACTQEVLLVHLHDGACELRVPDPQHLIGIAQLLHLGHLVFVELVSNGCLSLALCRFLNQSPQLCAKGPNLV
mmetsp:Transcript_88432/g.245545  ORF Transcript_88432/g.245545 Transcript_88432/m.245545 type:complete len:203 (+) Transcript_88432:441-1049(+)